MKMNSFVHLIENLFKSILHSNATLTSLVWHQLMRPACCFIKVLPKTPDHFARRLIQGKINNNFDHKGFMREYQQIIPKIYELRDCTGIRILEWSNDNPEDPVRKMDMQLESEVKKTQAECQEMTRNQKDPKKESLKLNEDDHCQT